MLLQPRHINDKISFFSDLPSLRVGAFGTLDAMQRVPNKAVQYLGPIVATVAMAEALGRDPHEDIGRVRRMMGTLEGPFTAEVQAIREYAKGELLNV